MNGAKHVFHGVTKDGNKTRLNKEGNEYVDKHHQNQERGAAARVESSLLAHVLHGKG